MSADELPCFFVNNLTSEIEQCEFIIKNGCTEGDSLIDYVSLVYCDIGTNYEALAILLLAVILVVLFIGLGSAANEFLCPSLLALSKILRMSDSVAGVTLLAFGNGCPDIFSSIAAASDDRPELIVGELLGAGIFCSSIVSGLVFINGDFRIATRPLLRDTIFYLLAAYIVWFACWDGFIKFSYAMSFIFIYIIYLIVALSGQRILQSYRAKQKEKQKRIAMIDRNKIESSKDGNLNPRRSISRGAQEVSNYGSVDNQVSTNAVDNANMFSVSGKMSIFGKGKSPNSPDATELGSTVSLLRYVSHDDPDSLPGSPLQYSAPIHGHFGNALRIIAKSDTHNDQHLTEEIGTSEHNNEDEAHVTVPRSNTPSAELIRPDLANLSAVKLYQSDDYNSQQRNITPTYEANFSKITAHADLEDEIYNKFAQSQAEIERHIHSQLPRRSETPSLISLNEWDDFLLHVCPIDMHEWRNSSLANRIFEVIRAPVYLLMIITVPVVDYESRRHNWCKVLNALHCVSVPVAMTMLSSTANIDTGLWGIPLYMAVIVPGLAMLVVVINTSTGLLVPRYHSLFAYIGFIMSTLWIYFLATEVISLLKTVGVMFSMSDAAIGLGILAWGNSLGDIVANLTLAKSGYPRMALGACIGAPLLNLLLGFGLSFSLSLGWAGQISFNYTPMLTLLFITISVILLTLMLATLLPAAASKKWLGYGLIAMYFVYFGTAIGLEYKIIS